MLSVWKITNIQYVERRLQTRIKRHVDNSFHGQQNQGLPFSATREDLPVVSDFIPRGLSQMQAGKDGEKGIAATRTETQ
jgi:hypothetical protein